MHTKIPTFSNNFVYIAHQNTFRDRLGLYGTIAVLLPNKEEVLSALTDFNQSIAVMIGLSRCHYQDQFKKKIGKDVSIRNLERQVLKLHDFKFLNNQTCANYPTMGGVTGYEMMGYSDIEVPHPHKGFTKYRVGVRFVVERDCPTIRLVAAWCDKLWEE